MNKKQSLKSGGFVGFKYRKEEFKEIKATIIVG